MRHEVKSFRLGDILQPNREELSPRAFRMMGRIRETLPKAFRWSDPERRVFVHLVPGSGKDPDPQILPGEYLNVVEMIPQENPRYTLLHEVESDRTLIFDGNNHWKWKKNEWIPARKKVERAVEANKAEASYEEMSLV